MYTVQCNLDALCDHTQSPIMQDRCAQFHPSTRDAQSTRSMQSIMHYAICKSGRTEVDNSPQQHSKPPKNNWKAPSQNLNPNLPDRSKSSTILNHSIPLPLPLLALHHNHNLNLLLLLILGPIILLLPRRNKLPRTPQQTIQPEQIQTLQHRQQRKSDDIRNPAFILLRLPVELVGAYGAELSQQRPEDAQVQVVAEVDPGSDVEGVEGDDEVRVDVVEGL